MQLHRPDVSLIDRTKIQAEVVVPLFKALEQELGIERARTLVRQALADEFRQLARDWVEEAAGDRMAAFMRFAAYSNAEDPLVYEARDAQPGEMRFDVLSCQYAQFFHELGEPELGFLLVCGADGPIAEGLGIGLERTQTLMQGGTHCDFRDLLAAPNASGPT
jgi:hypothetical protein